MNATLDVRPVDTPQAVARVAELARQIWREHFTPIIGPGQVDYMLEKFQSAEAVTRQMEQGYRYFLLARGGTEVGYLGFRLEEERLFLSKLYVIAQRRGTGIGRAAVDFLCDLARREGARSIDLTVNRHNHGSIAAYRRLGFSITGEVKQDIGGGYVMDDYQMRRSV